MPHALDSLLVAKLGISTQIEIHRPVRLYGRQLHRPYQHTRVDGGSEQQWLSGRFLRCGEGADLFELQAQPFQRHGCRRADARRGQNAPHQSFTLQEGSHRVDVPGQLVNGFLRRPGPLQFHHHVPTLAVPGVQVHRPGPADEFPVQHGQARLDQFRLPAQGRLQLRFAPGEQKAYFLSDLQRLGQVNVQHHHPDGLCRVFPARRQDAVPVFYRGGGAVGLRLPVHRLDAFRVVDLQGPVGFQHQQVRASLGGARRPALVGDLGLPCHLHQALARPGVTVQERREVCRVRVQELLTDTGEVRW